MRTAFVSECLVLGGIYLISNSNIHGYLGGFCLGVGTLGGVASFLYNISSNDAIEKRRSDILEISKSVIVRLLQAFNESSQKFEKTIH